MQEDSGLGLARGVANEPKPPKSWLRATVCEDVDVESIRTLCVCEKNRVTSNFSDVMLLDSSRSWFEPEVHGFNALQGHPARFSTHSSRFGWFSASTKIYGLLLRIPVENPVQQAPCYETKVLVEHPSLRPKKVDTARSHLKCLTTTSHLSVDPSKNRVVSPVLTTFTSFFVPYPKELPKRVLSSGAAGRDDTEKVANVAANGRGTGRHQC